MAVPDTTTFTLQNVADEFDLGSNDGLIDCFEEATSGDFDPSYSGDKDNLLNFRNYGATSNVWVVTDIALSQTKTLPTSFYSNNVADSQVYVDASGLKLFIVDFDNKHLAHYRIKAANDITSTLSFEEDSPSLSYFFSDFTFKSDGSKAYFLDYGSDKINEHSITTSFDVSTLNTTITSSVTLPTGITQGGSDFSFNRTGTKLYVRYKIGTVVTNATYVLSTAWDLSTASSPTTAIVTSSVDDPTGGVYMYETTGTYDHWILFSAGGDVTADFRDGITTSDINSSTTTAQVASPNPSCINNALIYDVERTGSSAPYTFILRKYLTNV